jgi:hypothetical protein
MAIGFGLNIPKPDKMVKIKSDLFVWIGGGPFRWRRPRELSGSKKPGLNTVDA